MPTLSPSRFSHVVLQSFDKSRLVEWYGHVFDAEVCYENPFIAFMRYDEEHHRFGFVQLPPIPPGRVEGLVPGLVHVAFAYDSIAGLLEQYGRMKDMGEKPVVAVNHGPTISLYYKDPDRNTLELFVDRFPTVEQCNEFMANEIFSSNPVGYDIDPDAMLSRLREGAPEEELLQYDEELGRSVNVEQLAQRHMGLMSS
jgi:catechol-2,3-dioxygenase